MSLLPFLLISIAVTGAALILRSRPTIATSVVLVGLVASLIAALAIRPGETIVIGGATVATTDFLRLFLVLGCLSGLALALLGVGAGTRRLPEPPDEPRVGHAQAQLEARQPRLDDLEQRRPDPPALPDKRA